MHLRAVADLPALALEHDPACLQDVRALAEVESEQRVLLDEEDRDVFLVVEPVQELDKLLAELQDRLGQP